MNILYDRVKAFEDEKRFSHTLSVKDECMNLAWIFSLTVPATRSLYKAAMLHDITKSYDKIPNGQYELAKELGITLSEDDIKSPSILHSLTGAALAERDFKEFVNPTVISAIKKHTTGSVDMSTTDKLLFLADYIEPTRKWQECIEARQYFYALLETQRKSTALDLCVMKCLENTLDHLKKEDKFIHPDTLRAYESLKTIYDKKI